MTRARKQANSSAGSIRIIGGTHRGRKLPVLNSEGLRPTTDRMKETLFNWLMSDVRGAKCIDCFAGAGSLGFEALSRGAESVDFLELDKKAAKQLAANAELLRYSSTQATIQQGDSLVVLNNFMPSQVADIIFIDPPFERNLVQPCIEKLNAKGLVKAGTKVYIEREIRDISTQLPANWRLIKDKSTQQVSAQLYLVE